MIRGLKFYFLRGKEGLASDGFRLQYGSFFFLLPELYHKSDYSKSKITHTPEIGEVTRTKKGLLLTESSLDVGWGEPEQPRTV